LSIRFRLTLLYSVILAVTLIALGVAIYLSVSQVTMNLATSSLDTEARNLSATLQPHPDPDRPGAFTVFPPTHDPGSLASVQVRDLRGAVIYRSPDLVADHFTIPLAVGIHQPLPLGDVVHNTVTFKEQRLLVSTVLIQSHANGPPGQPPHGPPTPFGVIQVARSLQDVDQTLNTLRQALFLGSAVATLLAFGAGWLLAGTALHPIRRITQSAQTIGDAQDFAQRVVYTGPRDEIGRLATTLNGMLARLQDAYQTQRRFAADASHELRTPLTSIRGNLGLLQREPPIAEGDRVAVLGDLVSESERLSRLVNDLLTLARSDAGRALRQEPVPLGPLLADVVRLLGASYPERTIQVDGQRAVTVVADPDALTQLLVILLDNALKFTPAGGTVGLSVSARDGMVSVAVRDTGPGIAPEALPHIFERFYQGDEARAGTGTGLGLAIAKSLVDGQHGTIAVASTIGRGSTFTVTLPASPDTGRG
jgi:two-component system, OmpR family, sensor kinase